jgi:hypothetical protein
MLPLESLVSDTTILSVTELSITILVASFTLNYGVYDTGITDDNCKLTILILL